MGDFYLTEIGISIIIVMIFSNTDFSYQTGRFLRFGNKKVKKEVYPYENDISAEKKAQKESPWVQEPDEHKGRKESFGS